MILYMTWFSEQGKQLAKKISKLPLSICYGQPHSRYGGQIATAGALESGEPMCSCENLYVRERKDRSLREWLREAFENQFPVVIIGALGIAVRSIAGFIQNKTVDSPVLVLDEAGQYVIPVLAGHLGGANELAQQIAAGLQMEYKGKKTTQPLAVVTTATDVHGIFAVDVFARRNGLRVCQPQRIRTVSGKLLQGKTITIAMDPDVVDLKTLENQQMPEGIEQISWQSFLQEKKADVVITTKRMWRELESTESKALVLCPKMTVLGMGCRKNKSYTEIEQMVKKIENQGLIDLDDVFALASVDRKAQEAGLQELAQHLRIPFVVFSAEELNCVPGNFASSEFVSQTVGVNNVCERAAVAGSDGGLLFVHKQIGNGVTLAACKREKTALDFQKNII